jgi:hypothetical protein
VVSVRSLLARSAIDFFENRPSRAPVGRARTSLAPRATPLVSQREGALGHARGAIDFFEK